MCLNCLSDPITLISQVLPGFSLMVSTQETPLWPKGWYALAEGEHPLVVFEGPLLPDPTIGLTEDDLDAMPAYPEGYDEYEAAAVRLGHALRVHPEVGYRLVRAAMDLGYSPQETGSLQFWLINYLNEKLESTA